MRPKYNIEQKLHLLLNEESKLQSELTLYHRSTQSIEVRSKQFELNILITLKQVEITTLQWVLEHITI